MHYSIYKWRKSLKQSNRWRFKEQFSTSTKREEDVFNKGEDSIVLDVAWLTESLLQLLLHIFFGVQEINLWLLKPKGIILQMTKSIQRNCCKSWIIFVTVTYFFWGAHFGPRQSWYHWVHQMGAFGITKRRQVLETQMNADSYYFIEILFWKLYHGIILRFYS